MMSIYAIIKQVGGGYLGRWRERASGDVADTAAADGGGCGTTTAPALATGVTAVVDGRASVARGKKHLYVSALVFDNTLSSHAFVYRSRARVFLVPVGSPVTEFRHSRLMV